MYVHVLVLRCEVASCSLLSPREGEVRELERQVKEMREAVTQLQLERTELHTKVYM